MHRGKLVIAQALAATFALAGCGSGAIFFDEIDGSPPKAAPSTFHTFDIDCKDGFEASGGQTALGSAAGTYHAACTYEGKKMPWRLIGSFSAAPIAANDWDAYRKKVTEKARRLNCPGVAVRISPPTKNQEGEAIGAFCVRVEGG